MNLVFKRDMPTEKGEILSDDVTREVFMEDLTSELCSRERECFQETKRGIGNSTGEATENVQL